jgi:hypothetical protein
MGVDMTRFRAMYGMQRFVLRTFPLIPIVPIGLLLGSFALSIAAYVKASRRTPLPA